MMRACYAAHVRVRGLRASLAQAAPPKGPAGAGRTRDVAVVSTSSRVLYHHHTSTLVVIIVRKYCLVTVALNSGPVQGVMVVVVYHAHWLRMLMRKGVASSRACPTCALHRSNPFATDAYLYVSACAYTDTFEQMCCAHIIVETSGVLTERLPSASCVACSSLLAPTASTNCELSRPLAVWLCTRTS